MTQPLTRLLAFAFALAVLAGTGAHARAEDALIRISVFDGDDEGGSIEDGEQRDYWRLRDNYPTSNLIAIRAKNWDDVTRELERQTVPSTRVDALVIESDGESFGYHDVHPVIYGPADDRIDISLPAVVERVFKPIVGKFNPRARIVFTGCQMVKVGSVQQKGAAMFKVASNFGLTDGMIYMNKTFGNSALFTLLQEPFYKQPTLKGKAGTAFAQMIWPLTLPSAAVINAVGNRGYELKISPKNSKFSQLRPSRWGNAMTDRMDDAAAAEWETALRVPRVPSTQDATF